MSHSKKLKKEILGIFSEQKINPNEINFEIEADLHYFGQSHDLTISIPEKLSKINIINEIIAGESSIPFSRMLSSTPTSIISPMVSLARAFISIIKSQSNYKIVWRKRSY